jgi:hypothetical protein
VTGQRTGALFEVAAFPGEQQFHTPAWVFEALALEFDLDVAAPTNGPLHVPCVSWYSVADDGLSQPWEGLVWCNPPFRDFRPWAERWASHPRGVIVGLMTGYHRGRRVVFGAADHVVFLPLEFLRDDGTILKPLQATFVAFRGVGETPALRLAATHDSAAVLRGMAA